MCVAGVPMGCFNLCLRGWDSNGMLEFVGVAGVPMGYFDFFVWLGFQWDA